MNWNVTCACASVRRAARGITDCYDRILAPSGLLATQFSLLRKIEGSTEINISELANSVQLDRTTLGRNLRLMERDGLVKLSTGADHRARTIQLTRKGKDALKLALPLWAKAQQQVRGLFPKNEREMLLSFLERIDILTR